MSDDYDPEGPTYDEAMAMFTEGVRRQIRAAYMRCAEIAEQYATDANLKGMHIQNDTARYIAELIKKEAP